MQENTTMYTSDKKPTLGSLIYCLLQTPGYSNKPTNRALLLRCSGHRMMENNQIIMLQLSLDYCASNKGNLVSGKLSVATGYL